MFFANVMCELGFTVRYRS